MAETKRAKRVQELEEATAHVLGADDSFRHIALRTQDTLILAEVRRGRLHLKHLWNDLVEKRKGVSNGNSDE